MARADHKREAQRSLDVKHTYSETFRLYLAGVTIPSLNESRNWHWTVEKVVRDTWYMMAAILPVGPILGPVDVEITVYFADRRRHDNDNYTPKFLMDGLVRAGVIPDDNSTVVRRTTVRCVVGAERYATQVDFSPARD